MQAQATHILLAEDAETDAKLVVAALRRMGWPLEYERVDDARAMRTALANRRWDVVLSDWAMPNFSALDALEIVKEAGLDIPFIIVSGTIGEELAVTAMRAGAHDYVLKDNLARLAPAIERELREARSRAERRKTDAALRISEARYRRIIETANQGVWIVDTNLKSTFVNDRMAVMLRSTPTEMLGTSPTDFLDEEARAQFARHIEGVGARSSPQVEIQYTRKDGTRFWALVESSAMLDASEGVEGGISMVMDITERKIAEEARRASDARFRRLWESGIILITISDTDGVLSDINEAGATMLGYTRDELLRARLRWRDITPEEWRSADEVALEQLKTLGAAAPWEKELMRKDGSRVPILAGAAMLQNNEGIAIAVDLTEKRRTESALVERMAIAALTGDIGIALSGGSPLQETLYGCAAAILKHLGAAVVRIWTLNASQNVLELQASAGLDTYVDSVQGSVPVDRLVVGRIAQERIPQLTNDVERDEFVNREWTQAVGIVAFAGYPLLVGGEVVGVIAMFARKRITDAVFKGLGTVADAVAVGIQRKLVERANTMLEAQLRHAQKMEAVGRLAGGVAHDFNNVLSVILSYTELILGDLKADDPLHQDVDEIRRAGKRAADLTRQLLMFSRQQVLEPRILDLNDVLSGMSKMLQRLVGEDITLNLNTATELRRVRVDPGSIEQVIMNLVVNARDAMPTGGEITIETVNRTLNQELASEHAGVKPGPYVLLSVVDTGVGMDAATQARAFEPFFTTKEQGKGTGLGLSTVFGIVQQSGGIVSIHSEPGNGAKVEVCLPSIDGLPDLTRTSLPATTRRGSETILIIEDEEQVRAVAKGILHRYGYRVLEARNAREAVQLCESHEGAIDLLLTDVVMPQISGPELARRLCQMRPSMKVLCMSGYTDDSIVRHGVLAAQIAYLQKPITPLTLTAKVREVLDGRTPAP